MAKNVLFYFLFVGTITTILVNIFYSARSRVLTNAHKSHQGLVSTKQRLRSKFWWPGLDGEAESLLRDCAICSVHDSHKKLCRPPLHPIPLPEGPWRRVMIDIIGPMSGPPQERFGIVLVDLYSRWPEVCFCREVTATTVVAFLRQIFSREGVPEELLSDNGPQFRAAETEQFLRSMGVRQVFSSPYSPQTCGMVERLNRTIKGAIWSAKLQGESRVPSVQVFLQNYRGTVHPATGMTPFSLMRGREMRTGLDILPLPVQPRPQLSAKVRRYQGSYKRRYDARRASSIPKWKVGDSVFVRHHRTGKVTGTPVRVDRQTGPVSYQLADGQRVHARRLLAASATECEPAGQAPFVWPSGPAGVTGVSGGAPPPASAPVRPRRPLPLIPSEPPVAIRKSHRVSRPPDRYSP